MASVALKEICKFYTCEHNERKKQKNAAGHTEQSPEYKIKPAVKNFNLDIKDREFIVIVGPSGCGKSTVLRLIAGLEDPSSGDIYIDKIRVNDVQSKDRDVAMVFQNYALYPHMTAYDNIAFALRKRIKSSAEIDSKVREAAKILGIAEYLDRKPNDMSGGQRQRVAIGRAIVRSPKVMLMDEPLSNLDSSLRSQMRTEFLSLRKKIDTTFIYVTHDQTEAMTLGDRIVVMNNGVIQQTGTPQEIFENPVNTFTAGFIGTPKINFFDAVLTKKEGIYNVSLGKFATNVSLSQQKSLEANNVPEGNIILGVRPESLRITDSEKSFHAVIDATEIMGSAVNIHLSHNSEKALIVTQELGENGKLKIDYIPGSRLNFRFSPQAMYLFDKETGKSLLFEEKQVIKA